MLVNGSSMNRSKLNTLLAIFALLGVFAALDIVAHKTAPHFWIKLVLAVGFSATCVIAMTDRDARDVFFSGVAALFSLFAIAMTFGDRTHANWWPLFLGFLGAASLFVLITRKKREALLGIAAIVGLRLLLVGIVYVLH